MKKWLVRIGISLAALVLLLLCVILVGTRPFVIRGLVLPRLSRTLETPLAVEGIQVAPFSRVQLEGMRVGAPDEALLDAGLLRVRYGFWGALAGRKQVKEVTARDVAVHLIRREDGSLNLPVLPERKHRDDEDEDEDEVEHLRVREVAVSGFSFAYTQREGPGQEPMRVRISEVSLAAPDLGSGREGTFRVQGTVDELELGAFRGCGGALEAEGTLGFDPFMGLSRFDLDGRLAFSRGQANAVVLAGREFRLEVRITGAAGAWSVESLSLSEARGGVTEAGIAVTGRAQRKPEALLDLEVAVDPLASAALDLVAALTGDLSLGTASGGYRGRVRVSSPGKFRRRFERNLEQPWTFTSEGELALTGLAPASSRLGFAAPAPFDVRLRHSASWNTESKALTLDALDLRAGTAERDILTVALSEPLSVQVRPGALPELAGQAVLAVRAQGVALASANAFLPSGVPAQVAQGRLDGDVSVTIEPQGGAAAAAVSGDLRLRCVGVVLRDREGHGGSPFSLASDVKARLGVDRTLQLEVFHLEAVPQDAGAPVLLTGQGRVAGDLSGDGSLVLSGLSERILAVLPESLAGRFPLQSFRGKGQATVSAQPGGLPAVSEVRLDLTDAVLREAPGSERLAGTLRASVEVRKDAIEVRSSELRLDRGAEALVQATVSGTVGLAEGAAGKRLAVSTRVVNVDGLLALLGGAGGAGAAAAESVPETLPETPSPMVLPPALPHLDVSADVDLQRLVFRGREFGVKGQIGLAKGVLNLTPLVLTVPGGDVRLEARLGGGAPDWEMTAVMTGPGEAVTGLADWLGKAVPEAILEGMSFRVGLAAGIEREGARLGVSAFTVDLRDAGQNPLLALQLAEPLGLALTAKPPLPEYARVVVTASRFPVALANAFLPAEKGLSIRDGMLDAGLDVTLRPVGKAARGKGEVTLSGLDFSRGETHFDDVGVRLQIEAEAEASGTLVVPRLQGSVTLGGASLASLSGRADMRRGAKGQGSFSFAADMPVLLSALGLTMDPAGRLRQGAVKGSIEAATPGGEGAPIDIALTVAADPLRFVGKDGSELPPWRADMAASGTLGSGAFRVTQGTFSAEAEGKSLARLAVSGRVAMPFLGGRSEFALTGDPLDAKGLLALVNGPEEDQAKERKKPGEEETETSEPGPIDLGATEVTGTVDLRNVIYAALKGNVACTLKLRDSVLTMDPLSGTLNGAPVSGKAVVNLAVKGFDYQVEAAVGQTDAGPLIGAFSPKLNGTVGAMLSGMNADFRGQGITMPSLRRNLNGSLSAGASNVSVAGIPGQAQLAQRLSVPELATIALETADLKARIENGRVLIDGLNSRAPQHRLGAVGSIGLDGSLGLDITLGVAGALRERLAGHAAFQDVFRHFRDEGEFKVTPVPIPLTGSLRKPRLDLTKFLGAVGTASLGDVLSGLLQSRSDSDKEGEKGSRAREPREPRPKEATEGPRPKEVREDAEAGGRQQQESPRGDRRKEERKARPQEEKPAEPVAAPEAEAAPDPAEPVPAPEAEAAPDPAEPVPAPEAEPAAEPARDLDQEPEEPDRKDKREQRAREREERKQEKKGAKPPEAGDAGAAPKAADEAGVAPVREDTADGAAAEDPRTDDETHRRNEDRRQKRREALEKTGSDLLRGLLAP
ncbi:MAG: hypothetical protein JXR77_19080 [Lentisphaeria bacterium]|nr:hypothetical protein [Lentisphaeria bacterium]